MRVLVDMSATLIHHGHIRILKKASELGTVVVALTSDKEIIKKKKFEPELEFNFRKEILESIKYVSEIIESPWVINQNFLDTNKIDYLLHGNDNFNNVKKSNLILVNRTSDVSSTDLRNKSLKTIINIKNEKKLMLTPGPAAILNEHLDMFGPVFGRGDSQYEFIFSRVTDWIKKLAKVDNLVAFQGSASNALELGAKSFIKGKVLIVDTGVYSSRFSLFLKQNKIDKEFHCKYEDLEKFEINVDWIMATYVETSTAFKSDIKILRNLANKLGAKLYIDATASIGLEEGHEYADMIAFSSCKGLFGITGAAFIGYKDSLNSHKIESEFFTMNLDNMEKHAITGPYHAICSLYGVIDKYEIFKDRVKKSKEDILNNFSIFYSKKYQPLLCTRLQKKLRAVDKNDNIIFYKPRISIEGSIVCHLGEIYKPDQDISKMIEEY